MAYRDAAFTTDAVSIANAVTANSSVPASGRPTLRRRLPAIVGRSVRRGDSRTTIIDFAEWRQFFNNIEDSYFEQFDWGEMVPSPPLVEFLMIEGESEDYSPTEKPKGGRRPPYVAFCEIASCLPDQDRLGIAALESCRAPTPEAIYRVERFVREYGPLNWGASEHSCYPNATAVTLGEFVPAEEWDIDVTFCRVLRNSSNRYVNSIPWILRESLVMRRAVALLQALREVRQGRGRKSLDQLWGIRRGQGGWLFEESFSVEAGERLEDLVWLSIIRLARLVNEHLKEAHTAATLSAMERWPKPKGGTLRANWLKPATQFVTPLVGLWLGLCNDAVWLFEERICPTCNEGFAPRRSDQMYCSSLCGARERNRRARARERSDSISVNGPGWG